MGGPKKTRPMLKKKYPRAFEAISRQRERAMKYPGQFNEIDVLVHLRSIMIDYRDKSVLKLTGYQWAIKLLDKANRSFKQEFAAVAMVMDKPGLVPPFKAPEEKARGAAKKNAFASKARKADARGEELPEQVVPFPRGSRLTEAGVEIPADAKTKREASVELLTMDRLLATRALRAELLELVKECLRKYGMSRMGLEDAEGRFLIIDSTGKRREKGGTEDNVSEGWRDFSTPASLFGWGGYVELPADKFDHPFGEADLGMLWWYHIFGDMDTIVDSNDTDQYPAWMSYIEQNLKLAADSPRRRRGAIKLRYANQEHDPATGKTKDEMCIDDLTELYCSLKQDGITASMFGLYHAIGGNDFSDKKFISNGVSEKTLLDQAGKSASLKRAAIVLETEPCLLPTDMQFVWWRVRYPDLEIKQDTNAYDRVVKHIDDYLENAATTKKALTQSEGTRDAAMRLVMWSHQYFCMPFYWFGNAAPWLRKVGTLVEEPTLAGSWKSYGAVYAAAPRVVVETPPPKIAAEVKQQREDEQGEEDEEHKRWLEPPAGVADEDDLFEQEANEVAAAEEALEAKSRPAQMDEDEDM